MCGEPQSYDDRANTRSATSNRNIAGEIRSQLAIAVAALLAAGSLALEAAKGSNPSLSLDDAQAMKDGANLIAEKLDGFAKIDLLRFEVVTRYKRTGNIDELRTFVRTDFLPALKREGKMINLLIAILAMSDTTEEDVVIEIANQLAIGGGLDEAVSNLRDAAMSKLHDSTLSKLGVPSNTNDDAKSSLISALRQAKGGKGNGLDALIEAIEGADEIHAIHVGPLPKSLSRAFAGR